LEEKAEMKKSWHPYLKPDLGTSLRCFAHCVVDFAGPFFIKLTRKVTAKRYLCLFTCASARAVYPEIAYSLDTASFLNALSRLVASRGKPGVMISDNGTNHQWRFNKPPPPPPAGGSYHRGIFEALIKSATKVLCAILGELRTTDEELLTAVALTAHFLSMF